MLQIYFQIHMFAGLLSQRAMKRKVMRKDGGAISLVHLMGFSAASYFVKDVRFRVESTTKNLAF